MCEIKPLTGNHPHEVEIPFSHGIHYPKAGSFGEIKVPIGFYVMCKHTWRGTWERVELPKKGEKLEFPADTWFRVFEEDWSRKMWKN